MKMKGTSAASIRARRANSLQDKIGESQDHSHLVVGLLDEAAGKPGFAVSARVACQTATMSAELRMSSRSSVCSPSDCT
jgi:hypothetical protein